MAARDSAKTRWLSPTAWSKPSAACNRIAIFSTKASTRVVLPLNWSAPTVNSTKSLYLLCGDPRWKYIRPAELAGMSR